MDNLKLLQLKHVELNRSYKNFPEIRWLCWYRSCLKTIPSGLLMSSLVAIDMTNGDLEEFESPVVVSAISIGCELTNVCTNIRGLASLDTLDLTGGNRLHTTSWNKKLDLQESLKALSIGGKIPQQAMVSLPDSLKFLFLYGCNLKYKNEVHVASNGQSFFYMNLGNNLFECLKYSNDFQTLRKLDVACDDIIKGRSGHMMLYEFGIISTYLPSIIYQRMMPEYMSSSWFLSFIVPSCPKKCNIKGLDVTSLYKSTCEDILALLAKVSNKTKGLTWTYNPVVYSKPKVDEAAVWLSY
ncbi:TMV resistance protein N-like protein [Tanacetum coccineum]